jgi:hypothetical protein
MTVRETVYRWLGRGSAIENAEEPVEIAIIPLAIGPMTVESLCERGFQCIRCPDVQHHHRRRQRLPDPGAAQGVRRRHEMSRRVR